MMKKICFIKDEKGYSLVEVLVVVVIIGILAMLAIPRYMSMTDRAKAVEAQTMLNQVYTLQQAFFYMHSRYSDNLDAIGFEQAPLITENGNARYLITIEYADVQGFTALATSVVDQNRNRDYNTWEVNESGYIRERIPF